MQHSGKIGIAALIAGLAAMYAYSRNANASTAESSYFTDNEFNSEPVWDFIPRTTPAGTPIDQIRLTDNDGIVSTDAGMNPYLDEFWGVNPAAGVAESIGEGAAMENINAFLAAVAYFESRNDYLKLFGGSHFHDYSRHPNVKIPFYNPAKKKNDYSTAAGAYQINFPTYSELAPRLGITDFSPQSQDRIAIELLKVTGAYNEILRGNIQGAFSLASKRWASLPGSDSMQPQSSMQMAMIQFTKSGGIV